MSKLDEIRQRREAIEVLADQRVRSWGCTYRGHCENGYYDKNEGTWRYKEPARVTAAMYALDAYRDAGKMIGELAQLVDDVLAEVESWQHRAEAAEAEFPRVAGFGICSVCEVKKDDYRHVNPRCQRYATDMCFKWRGPDGREGP
jgi:hypothetical protein